MFNIYFYEPVTIEDKPNLRYGFEWEVENEDHAELILSFFGIHQFPDYVSAGDLEGYLEDGELVLPPSYKSLKPLADKLLQFTWDCKESNMLLATT